MWFCRKPEVLIFGHLHFSHTYIHTFILTGIQAGFAAAFDNWATPWSFQGHAGVQRHPHPTKALSLQKQMLRQSGKGRKGDKQTAYRWRNEGDLWRLTAITSRQGDYHSTARITNYGEQHILMGVLPWAWSFAKSSVTTGKRATILRLYLILTSVRTFGERQQLCIDFETCLNWI